MVYKHKQVESMICLPWLHINDWLFECLLHQVCHDHLTQFPAACCNHEMKSHAFIFYERAQNGSHSAFLTKQTRHVHCAKAQKTL